MAKNSIATSYVQIVPSADGLKGKLSELFSASMPSAGQSAGSLLGGNLVGTLKTVIASAGLGAAVKNALSEGAELQQSIGGIETLFGTQGAKSVEEYAELVGRSVDKISEEYQMLQEAQALAMDNAARAYETAGLSANDYMQTVSGFAASLKQSVSSELEAAEAADQAVIDMADNANKMGTSMESIQNAYQGFAKQNYTMLDNLKLGYGGTKEEMKRLLADAEKLSGVKYDISNLADVYAAIHVIQDDLGITGTTSEEAASTFSGSMAAMKAAASNVLANLTLGEDVSDELYALSETVFTFVGDNLLPMVGNLFRGLPSVIESGFSMAVRGLNLLRGNAGAILQSGIELVTGIGEAIIVNLPYLAESGLMAVSAFGEALITTDWAQVAADTIGRLREGLDIAAGEILGTDGNLIQSVLDAIVLNLPLLLEQGVGMVTELANGFLAGIPGFLTAAAGLLEQLDSALLSALPSLLSGGYQLIVNLASGLGSALPEILITAGELIGGLLFEIASHLPELLEQGITLICELAAGLIAGIPDAVVSISQTIDEMVWAFLDYDWLQVGADILEGIAQGILNGLGIIVEAAKEAAAAALDAAKDFLGIQSPSRRFRDEVGKQSAAGIALGIRENTALVDSAMTELSGRMLSSGLALDVSASRAVRAGGSRQQAVTVVQNIYSEAKTASDLMLEARYQQEMAVLLGV